MQGEYRHRPGFLHEVRGSTPGVPLVLHHRVEPFRAGEELQARAAADLVVGERPRVIPRQEILRTASRVALADHGPRARGVLAVRVEVSAPGEYQRLAGVENSASKEAWRVAGDG